LLKSFTLIKAKPGTENSLVKEILKIPESFEVHSVMGEFDLLAVLGVDEELDASPWRQLTEILTNKIRTMKGVLETQTVIPTSSKIKKDHLFEFSKLARGFVFIDTTPGREVSVMRQLLQREAIQEVHLIPGKHDVLAVVEVKKTVLPPRYPEVIEKIVVDDICKIPDVKETETMIPDSSDFKERKKVVKD